MSGSFVVEVSRTNLNSSEYFYTTNNSITVGNDLQNNIRIREPSIEKVHLQILFDKMSIFVSGKDVFLNENPLEVGQTYPFSLGDTIKIHDVRLTINKTDSKQEESKQEGTFIKPIPTETISELSTIPADEVEVVAMIEKDEKEIFIKKEVHTNQFIKGDVLVQEVTEKIKVEEKEKVGKEGEDKEEEEGTMEVVDLNPKGDSIQTEEVNFKRDSLQTEAVNLNPKGDTLNTTEEVNFKGDSLQTEEVNLNPKNETTTTEEVNFNEKGENTFIKDSVELQKAVKILDNEEKNNLEMALEDGDLTSVKEAITNKKDDLNSEIRDTIEPEITVTDTPIDPTLSRRVMKDLGEFVLEKEILNDADKVVDEKLGVSEESLEENKVEDKGSSKEDTLKDNSKEDAFNESAKDNSKDEGKETLTEEESQTTSTSNSLTKPKSTPSKKSKVVNKIETPKKDTSSSTSFISRTPRRAASQTTVENPLMTPIPKRTKRNSTAPKSEKPKKK